MDYAYSSKLYFNLVSQSSAPPNFGPPRVAGAEQLAEDSSVSGTSRYLLGDQMVSAEPGAFSTHTAQSMLTYKFLAPGEEYSLMSCLPSLGGSLLRRRKSKKSSKSSSPKKQKTKGKKRANDQTPAFAFRKFTLCSGLKPVRNEQLSTSASTARRLVQH